MLCLYKLMVYLCNFLVVFFCKQKTAYEMRISDWSSDVCSSDLSGGGVWQGCAIGFATVTELTPDGPVDRGSFTDGMSSGAGLGQSEQDYEGRIVAAVR